MADRNPKGNLRLLGWGVTMAEWIKTFLEVHKVLAILGSLLLGVATVAWANPFSAGERQLATIPQPVAVTADQSREIARGVAEKAVADSVRIQEDKLALQLKPIVDSQLRIEERMTLDADRFNRGLLELRDQVVTARARRTR